MKEKTDQYLFILEAFEEALDLIDGEEYDIWAVIGVLADIRARYLFQIVSDDLMMSYEYAIKVVQDNIDKGTDEVTDNRALVLLSAMENLIDFATCQQYQMFRNMPSEISDDNYEEVEKIFEKFNYLYANVEDNVVDQSAIMAFAWLHFNDNATLQYTTQRDERVRYEHELLDKLTYKKNEFPAELIPPIDYNCRCFLVENGGESGNNTLESASWMAMVNPIFRESLAKGGRIFTDNHPYFDVDEDDEENINDIKEKIFDKWLGK